SPSSAPVVPETALRKVSCASAASNAALAIFSCAALVLFDAPTSPATTEPAAMIPTAQGPPKKSIAPLPACFKPVNAAAPTPLMVPAIPVTAAVELRPMDVNTLPAQSQPVPASSAACLDTRPSSR